MLMVPNLVFRFVRKNILEFSEATINTSNHYFAAKYCKRFLNVLHC